MAGSALHYCYTPLHQNIICADTAIAALPATVDALGARRAMITCGPHIPPDLVVDRWAPDVEGNSLLDFPFLHDVWSHDSSRNNLSNINTLRIYH